MWGLESRGRFSGEKRASFSSALFRIKERLCGRAELEASMKLKLKLKIRRFVRRACSNTLHTKLEQKI